MTEPTSQVHLNQIVDIPAANVTVTDSADYFTGAQVEAILAEVGLNWAKLARANTFTGGNQTIYYDGAIVGLILQSYAASANANGFISRRARGSAGSPSASLASDILLQLGGEGFVSGDFTGTSNVVEQFLAAENFATGATGSYIRWQTTTIGTTSRTTKLTLSDAGRLDGVKGGWTEEGGLYILVTAGEALTRGQVVMMSATTDGRVVKNAIDGDMPIGVVYADAASAAAVKIVVSGIAYVLPDTGITAARGNVIYSSSTAAGLVQQASSMPAASVHFREVGHWLDTGSGNGAITRAVIHFN